MKFIILLFLVASPSFGESLYPSYMKGAKIINETSDNKRYDFDGESWMVVNRARSKELHDQIAKQIKELEREISRLEKLKGKGEPSFKRNRFTAHVGFGTNGILGRRFSSGIEVKTREGFIFGGTYGFSIDETFSLSLSAFSTNAYLMGAGLSF